MRAIEAAFFMLLALAALFAGTGWYEGQKQRPGDPTPWVVLTAICVALAVVIVVALLLRELLRRRLPRIHEDVRFPPLMDTGVGDDSIVQVDKVDPRIKIEAVVAPDRDDRSATLLQLHKSDPVMRAFLRLTCDGGRVTNCMGFLTSVDPNHEDRSLSYQPTYLAWSKRDAATGTGHTFSHSASLDVAIVGLECHSELEYQLMVHDVSLRDRYRLEYDTSYALGVVISADDMAPIEKRFWLLVVHPKPKLIKPGVWQSPGAVLPTVTFHEVSGQTLPKAMWRPEPRAFTTDQAAELIRRLNGYGPISLDVHWVSGDHEAEQFAREIGGVLSAAHWSTAAMGGVGGIAIPPGIIMGYRDDHEHFNALEHLRRILEGMGLWVSRGQPQWATLGNAAELVVGPSER